MKNQQSEDGGESLPGPVQAEDESGSFKRWAWPAALWLAVLAAAAALLAGGTWLYESQQREQTLALLARTALRPAMELPVLAAPVAALPEPVVGLPPPAPFPCEKQGPRRQRHAARIRCQKHCASAAWPATTPRNACSAAAPPPAMAWPAVASR